MPTKQKKSSHRHSPPPAPEPRRNVLRTHPRLPGGIGLEKGMATREDIDYLEKTTLPPPTERHFNRELVTCMTPEVRDELRQAVVAGFFGTRVETPQLADRSEEAIRAEGVRKRVEHASEIAAQISAPILADLFEGVANLMRDWDLFSQRYPQSADRLAPLRDWWEATHRGGGRPSKPEPAPVQPKS